MKVIQRTHALVLFSFKFRLERRNYLQYQFLTIESSTGLNFLINGSKLKYHSYLHRLFIPLVKIKMKFYTYYQYKAN